MTDQIGTDQIGTNQISPGRKAGMRLGGFVKNNGYVGLAFFAAAALMLFMWFCNQMIPFGDRTILRMDLFHQYGPFFAELYERLVAGRSLLFSWNTGLGGGFLGNFFNYLSSPTGLLVLLFGHENIPEAIGWMVLLKCAFASGTFAHLLRRTHGRNDASIAAFGVLYAFCSFFIAYYWNVMWIDAMALLPLIILGIRSIVHERKFMLYTVTLAITLVSNYFMGYMICIFSVLFFLVTCFSEYNAASGLRPAAGGPKRRMKRIKDNRFLRAGLTFAYASLLGAALAAFALLPVWFTLKASSATSGSFPDKLSTYFNVFDFLVNHLADLKPTIRASGDPVLPNVYCGIAAILLVPLYLFVPKIKGREKAAHVLLLLLLFFSFNTNILNYVWHAMHFPNDLPFRFSFLYSFLLLWIAYKVFLNLKEIPLRAVVGVGAAAALFAVVAEKVGSKNIQDGTTSPVGGTIYITLAFIAAYTLIFAFMRRTPRAKSLSLTMLLLCCVITEVCAADVKNFEITQLKENFSDLKDFQEMKARLYKSDGSFFRMELTDSRTHTDPAWFDYRGISTFSSMAYERTSNLENNLGLGGNVINSYTYNPNTAVYNAMHNLKYLVENQNFQLPTGSRLLGPGSTFLDVLNPDLYTKRPEFTQARFTVFENRYCLPIGFWAANGLRAWDTDMGTNPFRVQGDFWELAGAGAGVFEPLALRRSEDFYPGGNFDAYTSEQYVGFSGKPAGEESSIPCFIDVEEPRNVYIMVDANYISDIRVNKADGGVAHRSHDEKAVWDLGLVTPEEPLSVDILLHKNDAPESGGFNAYVYALNMEVFTEGYETLKRGALELTRYEDTLLEGTINAPVNGLLYTSIPYDEGWQVSIDSKRVPVSAYVGIGAEDVRPTPPLVASLLKIRDKADQKQNVKLVQWLDRRIAKLDEKPVKPVKGGFLGVPLPQGEHIVTLRYVPQGLTAGVMISAAALILLAFTGLLGELLRRRKQGYVPAPPVPGTTGLFSTQDLNPEDFTLDVTWGGPPTVEEITPEEVAPQEENPEPAPPEEEFAPPTEEEETFELSLPDAPEEEQADAGAASINSILQEMQARAEELRRKMQVEAGPEEEDGQSFKLV